MISTMFDLHVWYPWMKEWTFKTEFTPVTEEEKAQWLECMDKKGDFSHELANRINQKANQIGYPVFVKLSSRSPKDYSTGPQKNIKDIIRTLCNSMRIYEDLRGFVCQSPIKVVAIRSFKTIDKASEFRCLSKAGKFVGMSQYSYREKFESIPLEEARSFAGIVHQELIKFIGFGDFIFDIGKTAKGWKLIELNPFDYETDPCLFDWKKDNFSQFEARIVE